jgi:hypothetical protein
MRNWQAPPTPSVADLGVPSDEGNEDEKSHLLLMFSLSLG